MVDLIDKPVGFTIADLESGPEGLGAPLLIFIKQKVCKGLK